jgi:GNAT superfamily N-acetyltransferase
MSAWLIEDLKTTNLRRTFVAATPLGDDYMREGVKLCRKRKSYIAVALFKSLGKDLIGWAMLDIFLSKQSKSVRTYIYVKTKYRRKGYGTRILQKAKEVAKKRYKYKGIKVCPHTKSSLKFFKKANVTKEEVVRGYKY